MIAGIMIQPALDLVIAALERIRETSDRAPSVSRNTLAHLQSACFVASPTGRQLKQTTSNKAQILASVRERVRSCTKCAHLANSRTQTVFGVGNPDAEIMQRWQNICDYRSYADRVLSGQSRRGFSENLTSVMKRSERIALSLRTCDGVAASELRHFGPETTELMSLGLLRKSNDNFLLTRKGKSLADSVAEAFL